ncbi:hypothetical protein K490DRAFT_55964 [Saccharata proteae CBS 121410]|uniref:Uncharacterized protein n=1 Tax=Saccharata proteae CBS 121410 TaxID=1314787 RepID=A0A9P4LWJ0_9PEZI|nr:hypothetical protein K490DRAFT_55964 [Saccharata proteae CBS 121410]
MSSQATLQGLPEELISQIALDPDQTSFSALRLSSKLLEQNSEYTCGTRFFKHYDLILSDSTMRVVRDMSVLPNLSSLQVLSLTDVRCTQSSFEELLRLTSVILIDAEYRETNLTMIRDNMNLVTIESWQLIMGENDEAVYELPHEYIRMEDLHEANETDDISQDWVKASGTLDDGTIPNELHRKGILNVKECLDLMVSGIEYKHA